MQSYLLNKMYYARILISFALGSLTILALPPFNLWIFLFIGLSGLYWSLSYITRPRDAFILTYSFSMGYFIFGLYWIGNALLINDTYKWAWPFAVIGLPLLLSLFHALSIWMGAYILQKRHLHFTSAIGYLTFICTLSASEWLRGNLFTGFPWNLFGYGWNGALPVLQTLSLYGVYGLTLMTLFWCTIPGLLICKAPSTHIKKIFGSVAFFTLILATLYGTIRLENLPTRYNQNHTFQIAQANIAQQEKWAPSKRFQNFKRTIDITKDSGETAKYLIWPETAISDIILNSPSYSDYLQEFLNDPLSPSTLITGHLRFRNNSSNLYTNSITILNQNGTFNKSYDKHHLVPFGEYIPLQSLIPIETITKFSGFQKGAGPATLKIDQLKISPLICYEILFPGHVVSQYTNINSRPDVIINTTNDGWYGDSTGPHQHLAKARFRAIEEGIPVIRAAGTGISAIIDPVGRILNTIPLNTAGQITSPLPIATNERTLYSRYKETFFLAGLLYIIVTATFMNKKRKKTFKK